MTEKINVGVMPESNSYENNKSELLFTLSDEFERDSRRYNRAFQEESEVGAV